MSFPVEIFGLNELDANERGKTRNSSAQRIDIGG